MWIDIMCNMVNDRIRSPRLAYDFECSTEYYIIQTYMYIRHPGSPDIINRNRYVIVYTRPAIYLSHSTFEGYR